MPSFSVSPAKYMARELHMGFLYPLLTGNYRIPEGKGYWYLCNEQPNSEGSEYHQLTMLKRDSGHAFARPDQCYGVDRSLRTIKKNRKLHPESNWICAEWNEAIQDQTIFNPALVYLDTTSFADRMPALNALKDTLLRCKRETLVIANVMMSHPRAGSGDVLFDENALVNNLLGGDHPETFAAWNVSPEREQKHIVYSYEYRTSKTLMRSYVFFKGVLPSSRLREEFDKFKKWCSFSFQTEEID